MKDDKERSLDRMIEALRRSTATTRAVMNIKLRLRDAGIFVPLSSREHFLAAADFRGWAKTETDPKEEGRIDQPREPVGGSRPQGPRRESGR
jgi:hypothetical protein